MAGRLVLLGRLNVGQLTEFYLYLGFLIPPIRMIGPQINMTSRAIASGKRIFEVLDTESAVKEKPGAAVLSDIKGDIQFDNVNFHYESARSGQIIRQYPAGYQHRSQIRRNGRIIGRHRQR